MKTPDSATRYTIQIAAAHRNSTAAQGESAVRGVAYGEGDSTAIMIDGLTPLSVSVSGATFLCFVQCVDPASQIWVDALRLLSNGESEMLLRGRGRTAWMGCNVAASAGPFIRTRP